MRYRLFLIPILMATFGCAERQPPEIAGQRINSEGIVTERIVRVETYHPHTALLTPEGPKNYVTITCRYYVQKDDKARREFSIGDSGKESLLNPFLAVSNSPLWITFFEDIIWTNRPEAAHLVETGPFLGPGGKPKISYEVNDLHICVFDENGFFRERTFMVRQKGETGFMPEGQVYAGEYQFENGNRKVLFKSPMGLKKYDVVNDSVTDAGPGEDRWK